MPESPETEPQQEVSAAGAQGILIGDHNVQHNYFAGRGPISWPVRVGRPPALADCLQPRPAEAAALRQALIRDDETGTVVVSSVLSGMGGVGKTQLAAAFHRSWCAEPGATGLALWATASSRDGIVTAYAQGAAAVAEPGDSPVPEDPVAATTWLLNWLSAARRPWLVVLDDLVDPADMQGLWPDGAAGACLVTTRRADTTLRRHGRVMVTVGLFTSAQSRSYLVDKVGGVTDENPAVLDEVDDLAEDLQHLPLALAQAAAFVIDRAGAGETCASYRGQLADSHRRLREIFPKDALADDYERTVAATWSLSILAADHLAPTGLARPLLELASFLDPHGFPADLLASRSAQGYADRAVDEHDCRRAIANLSRLSLVAFDTAAGPRAVRVHALIQRATRERLLDQATTSRAAADALVDVWKENPHYPEIGQALRDNAVVLGRHAAEHLWTTNGHEVLYRAGVSLGEAGQAGAARAYWTALAADADEHLGPDHLQTLIAQSNIARWCGEMGEPATAARAYAQLLVDYERVLGSDHPETLATRSNLAQWRVNSGDDGAVSAYNDLIPELARVLGPSHPYTLTARANQASHLVTLGDPAGPVAYGRLIPDLVRVQGRLHPLTLIARANLADWRHRTGDPAGAARDLTELLPDFLMALGPYHTSTLNTRAHIAGYYGEAGDWPRAVAALTELLPDQRHVLGPDHLATLNTRHNLAYWHMKAGNPQAAARGYAELVPDLARVLGPDHPHTMTSRRLCAVCLGQADNKAGAMTGFAALIPDLERLSGRDHPDTLNARHWAAQFLGDTGNPTGAVHAYLELIFDYERVLGLDHPHTQAARDALEKWREEAHRRRR